MKHRSIDAGWDIDESVFIFDFCSEGYLYFNGFKVYVYGDRGRSFRANLINSDILALGYGDGIYRFEYLTKTVASNRYWKVESGRVQLGAFYYNDGFEHGSHFYHHYVDSGVAIMFKFNSQEIIVNSVVHPLDSHYYDIVSASFHEFVGYSLEEV